MPPTQRTFLHLLSHKENIARTEEFQQLRAETFPQWRNLFAHVDPAGQTFRRNDSDDFLLELFGKFRINSFSVMSPFKVGHSQYQGTRYHFSNNWMRRKYSRINDQSSFECSYIVQIL